MGREIEELATRLQERAFLYVDAESFREGVRATVRAYNALVEVRDHTRTAGQTKDHAAG